MMAIFPVDWYVHDTYFIVAHFHYVLFGGSAFALMGGLYYWFPKFTGRMFSEALGKLSFWTMFVGFNVTFLIQHSAGLSGMPRRIYDYPEGLGVSDLQPGLLDRIIRTRRRRRDGRRQPAVEQQAGLTGGKRPLEREHPRVVHPVATASNNFDVIPQSPQRRADEGHPPPGRRRDLARGHGGTANHAS